MVTTEIKERPILFSAPMVLAILEGKKTQTRRIIKPQPPADINGLYGGEFRTRAPHQLEDYETGHPAGFGFENEDRIWRCPYGRPGDRLWVREAWRLGESNPNGLTVARYCVADGVEHWRVPGPTELSALGTTARSGVTVPSIHMPRWASRITLEITEVRVARLHEISEDDAFAEGVGPGFVPHYDSKRGVPTTVCVGYRPMFFRIWREINGEESLKANPWVWAVSFKRIMRGCV